MERDPFILTGLMWAWLEQLKEPVISTDDAKALDPNNTDAKTVLNTLDQVRGYPVLIHILNNSNILLNWPDDEPLFFLSFTGLVIFSQAPKETLMCILDCMAHMLMAPEVVESAFLNRTIKAFTWVRKTIQLIISTLFQQLNSFPYHRFCLSNLRILFFFWTDGKKLRGWEQIIRVPDSSPKVCP